MNSNDTIRKILGGFNEAVAVFEETLKYLEVRQKTDPSDELKSEIYHIRKVIRNCDGAWPILIEVAQKECTHELRFLGYNGDEDVYKCEHCGYQETIPFVIRRNHRG